MACFAFGGNPHRLLEMNNLLIHHAYNNFYNKISRTSLNQWLLDKLDVSQELNFNFVTNGAIKEIQFEDDQVVDRQWILHHFEYDCFCNFGFLDDFAHPTARPWNLATQREGFYENSQRAFYLRYFHEHGLKAQVVYLPIGLIGSIFIIKIRQNNNGILNMSGFVGFCWAIKYVDFSHAFTVMAYL
jgi:hypothetical protein